MYRDTSNGTLCKYLTDAICIKMQQRLIQKYQKGDHTGSIKSNQLQAYEKERQNSLFNKREMSCKKLSTSKKRQEIFFVKKCNGRSRHSTIHQQEDSSQRPSIKDCPEMNSCSEERNPDQKRLETEKFARKVCRKGVMCNNEIWNHQESRSSFTQSLCPLFFIKSNSYLFTK